MPSSHPTPIYDTLSVTLPYLFPPSIRDPLLDGTSPLLKWTPGVTPFSTFPVVLLAGAVYLGTIFGGRALMRKFKLGPWKLQTPFVLHNAILSIGSGLLLAAMLEEILPIWREHGFYYAICARASWTPRMETMYILNYMFKYYELVDTVMMMLKGKPLAFLHVYHHSATALLCFSQLLGKTSVSWVVITLNLFVHVVMYLYYMLAAMRVPCPWKRCVTVLQITQFVLDLGVVYYASYSYFVYKFGLPLPLSSCASKHDGCAARYSHAVLSGVCILSSYLVLFVAFYKKTYNQRKAAGASQRNFIRTSKVAVTTAAKSDMLDAPSSAPVTRSRTSTPLLEKSGLH